MTTTTPEKSPTRRLFGYKKCIGGSSIDNGNFTSVIVQLEIDQWYRTFLQPGGECRCERATPIRFHFLNEEMSIWTPSFGPGAHYSHPNVKMGQVFSIYQMQRGHFFEYKLNEPIVVLDYDPKNIPCSTGIHFFETYDQALRFYFY